MMPVVLDLRSFSEESCGLLIDIVLTANEGARCEYILYLGARRFSPIMKEKIFRFCRSRISRIRGSQDGETSLRPARLRRLHRELNSLAPSRDRAQQLWYEQNIYFLDLVKEYDQFIYLTPRTLPVRDSWLSDLVTMARDSSVPITSSLRYLLCKDKTYRPCGWAMTGWINAALLRKSGVIKSCTESSPNPWRSIADFQAQTRGPGFCLDTPVLSLDSVPIDYMLYFHYYRQITGTDDPKSWKDAFQGRSSAVSFEQDDRDGDFSVGVSSTPVLRYVSSIEVNRNIDILYNLTATTVKKDVLSPYGDYPSFAPRLLDTLEHRFALQDLKGLFKGESCYIVGNSSSVKGTLRRLDGEYVIANGEDYLDLPKNGIKPSILCTSKSELSLDTVKSLRSFHGLKFSSISLEPILKCHWNSFYFEEAEASNLLDETAEIIWASSYGPLFSNLQVALYLGFDSVFIIGVAEPLVAGVSGDAQEAAEAMRSTVSEVGISSWCRSREGRRQITAIKIARDMLLKRGAKVVEVEGQITTGLFPLLPFERLAT